MRILNKDEEPDDSTEVTWEDQQNINTFAKLNSRKKDIEARLTRLRSDKEALDDLSTELELVDEDEPVLYRIGEAFCKISLSEAQRLLESDQAAKDKELSSITNTIEECEKSMKELKIILYSKFGSSINLDER